jgi:PAS domain S-box-containing protein
MNMTVLIELIHNAALLLALCLLCDMAPMERESRRFRVQALTGVFLGTIGVLVMRAPWEAAPGVLFDTRSILLSVGGLFFGWLPTTMAILMTGVYRLYVGGTGIWSGIAVIVVSGGLGIGWHHIRRDRLDPVSWPELLIFGAVTNAAMLIGNRLLPGVEANAALATTLLPVLVVYPVGTVLLGKLMSDRLKRRRTTEAHEHRLALERTVSGISARFVGPYDSDEAIDASLAEIGRLCGADRAYVFLHREGSNTVDNTHEWCTNGVTPQIDNLQNLPVDAFLWWMAQLKDNGIIHVADVSALPDTASSERTLLQIQGVKSLLVLPLTVGGDPVGFLGFDNVSESGLWGADDVALLRVVSRIWSSAFERNQTQEQLAFQATLLDQIQDLVTATDLTGRITYVNEAECRVFGKTADELIGQGVAHYGEDPDRGATQQEIIETTLAEGLWRGEVVNINEDGHKTILDSRVQLVHDNHGKPVGMLGISSDITERVRIEAARKESEARFRGLFDNSPIALLEEDFSKVKTYLDDLQVSGITDFHSHFEVHPDLARHCASLVDALDVNAATLDLFDVQSKEQILGALGKVFADKSFEIFVDEICAFSEGETVFECENVGRSLTGRLIDCVIRVIIAPGYEDSWSRVLVAVTDITEHVRAEGALRESERRYRSLFDNSPISLWEEDFSKVKELLDDLVASGVADMRAHLASHPDITAQCLRLVDIVDVNKVTAKLYAAESREQVLGSLDKLFIEDGITIFRDEISTLFEGETVFECVNVGKTLTGALLEFAVKVTIAPGCEKSWSRILVSVTDITDRVRAEKALRENQQRLGKALAELRAAQGQMMQQERLAAVGQLSAGIAHDFNNILASIVLYTQLSLRGNELSPTIRKRLEIIAEQADYAADLVQQIVDFGQRSMLDRRSLDMGGLLRKTAKLLARALPDNIIVDLEIEPGNSTIHADQTRVQQAITNLALNARDAMPDGGEIRLALSPTKSREITCTVCGQVNQGEWVEVAVTDCGTGIASDVLPHIFEPFFTTRAPLGHGLGLAQVYGIVNQHDGHIGVETEVGQGTTFRLYWPALAETASEAQIKPVETPHEGQMILVVEDNAPLRVALVDLVETLGYSVLAAANGAEAMTVCKAHKDDIALVLTDWIMPSMNGLQLATEMETRNYKAKVLVLTGHKLVEETQRTLPKNVTGWLTKPPDLDHLSQAIAHALADEKSTESI